MKRALILLLAVAISPASQAGLVTFSWTSLYSTPELLSGSAYWTLDESAIVPGGSAEYASLITDFGFNWTTNLGPVSLNPSNGFLNSAAMSFDALSQLTSVTVCVSAIVTPCGFPVHPSFELIYAVGWGASVSPDRLFSAVFGNTPITQTVSEVPEPGLLQLLALGWLLLGWRYRNDVFRLR
jgi:hypothetical protein